MASDENELLYSASVPAGSKMDDSINQVMDVYYSDSDKLYSSTIKGIIKKTPADVIDAQKQAFDDPEVKASFPENFYDDYVVHFTIEPYDYSVAMYLTYGGLIVTFISLLLVFAFYTSEKKKYDYAITHEASMQRESRFGKRDYETSVPSHTNIQPKQQNQNNVSNQSQTIPTKQPSSQQPNDGYVVLEKRKGEKEASLRTIATLEAEEQSRYVKPVDIDGDGEENDISTYFVDDIDYNADIKEKEEEERRKLLEERKNEIAEFEKRSNDINSGFKGFFSD